MTAEKYTKLIIKKIACDQKKKKDIQRQLLADIEERGQNGETLADIMQQMGTVQEIADGFNEMIPEQEKRRCRMQRRCRVAVILLAVIIAAVALLYWYLPKFRNGNDSGDFNQKQIEETLYDTITLLEQRDYEKLQDMATAQMQDVLCAEVLDNAMDAVGPDWGARTAVGNIYTEEVTQMNERYMICQVSVSYENISVIYTITYDSHMKLAGLYLK